VLTKKVFIFIFFQQTKCSFFKDTEGEERDQLTNGSHKFPGISKTESIEFDNGLKLDLSSVDGQTSDVNSRRRSIDSDFDAIKKSKARVGDWQTNFTLIESKVELIEVDCI
jgi:hypothetical protein